MKLSNLYTTLFFSLCLSFQSCLDMSPEEQLSDSDMWKNPGQFEAFAKNFYGWTRDFGGLGDAHGDVQADLFSTNPRNIFSNGTSTIPLTDKSYTDAYANLRQVNLLLQKAESYSLPEGIKVPVGEAYFFRAYIYFDLLQRFGGVIKVEEPLDITSPELYRAQNTREEITEFIISDLNEAIARLPKFKDITTANAGTISLEGAQAFLSRVGLYAGTWEKFHNGNGSNTELSKKWLKIAYEAADAVIESKTFELFKPSDLVIEGDEGAAYRYLFILENEKSNPAGINKSANKEYIFSRRHDTTLAPIGINITEGRFNNALYVTRKLANMYLQKSTGLPINISTWNYSAKNSEYFDRDNRMSSIMMVDGGFYFSSNGGRYRRTWLGDAAEIKAAGLTAHNASGGTGYRCRKWCSEREVENRNEGYDYPIIRYAEVLLNYAEAKFECDDNISEPDLDKSLNLVRLRVNPTMPKLSNGLLRGTGTNMRTEIRRERTVELIDECFRLDDLKRWKTAEYEMPEDMLGIKYTGTAFETSGWAGVVTNTEGCLIWESGRKWDNKQYLYPFPLDQLQLNTNLRPNWQSTNPYVK